MELLRNSRSFFQPHILLSNSIFFSFTRFDFGCAGVPPPDAAFLQEWVVPKQEPSIDAILSKYSRLEFKWDAPGKPPPAQCAHLLLIIGMNDSGDRVHRPILLWCQTCVFAGNTIRIDPSAFGIQHESDLWDQIYK